MFARYLLDRENGVLTTRAGRLQRQQHSMHWRARASPQAPQKQCDKHTITHAYIHTYIQERERGTQREADGNRRVAVVRLIEVQLAACRADSVLLL